MSITRFILSYHHDQMDKHKLQGQLLLVWFIGHDPMAHARGGSTEGGCVRGLPNPGYSLDNPKKVVIDMHCENTVLTRGSYFSNVVYKVQTEPKPNQRLPQKFNHLFSMPCPMRSKDIKKRIRDDCCKRYKHYLKMLVLVCQR